MPDSIELDGKTYEHVKTQRGQLSVYRSDDSYMRIGPSDAIERDLSTHHDMEHAGFPVPRVLRRGTIEYGDYFIEQSLGDKTFRMIFAEDYAELGAVSDMHFNEFVRITESLLRAQLATRGGVLDRDEFAGGIHLDILKAELPAAADAIERRFDAALARTSPLSPVLSHGDYGPPNVYPLGIIDIEDAFHAPFGFDAVSGICTIDWFPFGDQYEFRAQYRFTTEQVARYYAMCDGVCAQAGLPALSAFKDDLEFFRAVWLTVRMHEWPHIQKFRYDLFASKYLS